MDTQLQRKSREKVVEKPQEGRRLKQEGREEGVQIQAKQQPQATSSPASPPSASSSPSHEFSFTISLHPTSTATPVPDCKSKTPPNSFAIDLSPADDIFFHGHLLPLHLLSHLPVSPRSSTNSLDSFTLPIKELSDDQIRPNKSSDNCNSNSSSNGNSNSSSSSSSSSNDNINNYCSHHQSRDTYFGTKGRSKPKSFSLFGWRKGCEVKEKEEEEEEDGDDKDKNKKKLKFDVSQVLKRYARMVRPLMFFKGRRSENLRQPYSFSGNLSWRKKQDQLRGRRGQYSAPASMRTSPTNSGLLLATATLPSSTSDSTMEELQAAIQAAIAHCKNSIAAEEKIKC